jgi:hypothetical protein
MKRTPVWILATFLAACSGPMDTKIDGSTPDAYQKSLSAIKSRMSPEDAKRFEDSLVVVGMSAMIPKEGGLLGMFAAMGNPEQLQRKAMEAVNGKTPREIIQAADAQKRERAEGELRSVTEELATLEKRKAEADASRPFLAKIVVGAPRYYWRTGSYMDQPMISMRVTNNTDKALSRIYYHGTVTTPGRTIPWIDDDFNNEIRGGLEPGESKDLDLAPNMFSNWGPKETKERTDLVLTVRVINAEGVDHSKIAPEFEKQDEARLQQLQKMKADLQGSPAAK